MQLVSLTDVDIVVSAVFASLVGVVQVLALSVLWMLVFALLGVQFLNGAMKRRCVLPYPANGNNISNDAMTTTLTTLAESHTLASNATFLLTAVAVSATTTATAAPLFMSNDTQEANAGYQNWINDKGEPSCRSVLWYSCDCY